MTRSGDLARPGRIGSVGVGVYLLVLGLLATGVGLLAARVAAERPPVETARGSLAAAIPAPVREPSITGSPFTRPFPTEQAGPSATRSPGPPSAPLALSQERPGRVRSALVRGARSAGTPLGAAVGAASAAGTTTGTKSGTTTGTKSGTTSGTKSKAATKAAIRPTAGRSYELANLVTGKCLEPTPGGQTVVQSVCGRGQRVVLSPVRRTGGTQLYLLRDSDATQACVDVPGTGSQPFGTRLVMNLCITPSTADNQEFILEDIGSASGGREEYLLVNVKTGGCLDVLNDPSQGPDRTDGRSLTVATCGSAARGWDDHRWIFR